MLNEVINRKNTNSAKWDEAIYETQSNETIALSVADMDFRSAPEIVSALISSANHGVYGYTNLSATYYQIVKKWMKKKYDWDVSEEWIVFCPRIIQGISLIIQNNTEIGDKIAIQTPLYSPLKNAIELNERTVVNSPLLYKNNSYEMDFIDLEKKFSQGVKAFILCSPHNPVGRVWNEDELLKLAEMCVKYNVLLISDEVHADFTWQKPHIPIGKIKAIKDNIIVCTSPAKTFNLPGLEISNIIIPNQFLREKFQKNLKQAGFHNPTYFAEPALEQAYLHGENWLTKTKAYISENYIFVSNYLNNNLPKLKAVKLEGTYLMWINYKNLGLSESDIKKWFFEDAGVAVSLGSSFGAEGDGFIRLNIATSRIRLQAALDRISSSYPLKKEGGISK